MLTEKQSEVIQRRLLNADRETYQAIGDSLGTTRQAVEYNYQLAMKKLRKSWKYTVWNKPAEGLYKYITLKGGYMYEEELNDIPDWRMLVELHPLIGRRREKGKFIYFTKAV